MPFDSVPSNASFNPQNFAAHVPDEQLKDFQQLLKLSKIGPKTYENLKEDRSFGITREWLENTKKHWETAYDWRKTEERINALPQYTVKIEDTDLHFMALFSKKPDAAPIALLHGWPGSFLEFLGVCELAKDKYDENSLPFHFIVPSLPGYAYSSGPTLEKDYTTEDIARVVDKLMTGLGFSNYISQGGDIGSFVTRVLGAQYDSCVAAHLNFAAGIQKPEDQSIESLSKQEQWGLKRMSDFGSTGNAYSKEHGTRPGTIGLVLSSSPVALLAWIGEKFQQWTDQDPSTDEILDSITLYWLTDSFPRCIYPYRQFFGEKPTFFHSSPDLKIKNKPLGYSYFPWELAPVPLSWIKENDNVVWSRVHQEGGHFAAMEKPKLFLQDMEDFVAEAWKKTRSGRL